MVIMTIRLHNVRTVPAGRIYVKFDIEAFYYSLS